jgi:Fatty acid desaturase
MLVFMAAAVFGRIIHEMVNYVQHYGLVRADGAPIETRHAWDSCRLVSNALHYNLPRHADHHMFASKPFWELDLAADAPRLPRGYQTMSLIALYPPAWHRAIDPLLADWDGRLANDVERSLVRDRGWSVAQSRVPDERARERERRSGTQGPHDDLRILSSSTCDGRLRGGDHNVR